MIDRLEADLRERLGFCGCGSDADALEYAKSGLAFIEERYRIPRDERWDARFNEQDQRELQYFGSNAAREFFWYWADTRGLAEHGSMIPGWLTELGKTVLADLRRHLTEKDAERKSPKAGGGGTFPLTRTPPPA